MRPKTLMALARKMAPERIYEESEGLCDKGH